jgi:hypothetical protein
MSVDVRESVRQALNDFSAAKAMIENHFQAGSAAEIVAAVLKGTHPRAGDLSEGATYFVHGTGYTVTLPPERLVHIDSGDQGDVFSVYDLQHYLADAEGDDAAPELAALTEELNALVTQGRIRFAGGVKYTW